MWHTGGAETPGGHLERTRSLPGMPDYTLEQWAMTSGQWAMTRGQWWPVDEVTLTRAMGGIFWDYWLTVVTSPPSFDPLGIQCTLWENFCHLSSISIIVFLSFLPPFLPTFHLSFLRSSISSFPHYFPHTFLIPLYRLRFNQLFIYVRFHQISKV